MPDPMPIVRWPLVCPFCHATAPLTAYDLREGGIYTCSACQMVLRPAMWQTPCGGLGHLRWPIPLPEDDDAHAAG
jgi:hypothetical protein